VNREGEEEKKRNLKKEKVEEGEENKGRED
jgi:hypothetical protein